MIANDDEPRYIRLREAFQVAVGALHQQSDDVSLPRWALIRLMDEAGQSITFAAAAERRAKRHNAA